MKASKHFKFSEFDCKNGEPVPVEFYDNVKELAKNLEVLRYYFGKPIIINSSYRSPEHNKAIGGVSNSQHLKAKASDIVINGVEPKEVYRAIESLIDRGLMKQGGLGLYYTFVHYDIRGTKARW